MGDLELPAPGRILLPEMTLPVMTGSPATTKMPPPSYQFCGPVISLFVITLPVIVGEL